ncbi:hypothetical protein FA13DRAFT_1743134 [Coprinellus micaceus]|uniref:Uncharacterized protein n=1 Tax=Coprinellus micaceus TaxID=71717 RepID=A0A4Y7SF19_COPMI|nr:hypothetical protein FA13DRAFT_1743134 [Coprinellus micaceus]
MRDTLDPAAIAARDKAEQYHMLLGFWLGAVVFGLYTCLFAFFVKITIQTRRRNPPLSAKIFSLGALVMYILTVIYMGFNTSRYLYAFSPDWTDASDGKLPVSYLREWLRPPNLATSIIMGVLVWIGDSLVIYRCLIIWQMNWWVIAMPGLLYIFSIVNSAVIQVGYKRPTLLTPTQAMSLMNMVFPINIALSCLTTGLITFRIWRQHRASRVAGLSEHGAGLGLLTIIRIIVESTMIFTIQQVLLCILYYFDSPAQWALHGTLVPSMGVVFVLLSIRVHEAKTAPHPTLRLPWGSGLSTSTPWTTSNGTSNAVSHAPHRRRGHRRTVSDGIVFATPSVSLSERVHHPPAPFRGTSDEALDLERGDVGFEKSVLDAILPVNDWRKALGYSSRPPYI